jgi:hypothetical protein
VAYRIFVSHVWRAHHEYYWGLIRLLDQAKRFKFEDLSVPKLRRFDGSFSEVREDILRILGNADVVLTINTPVITNSLAVQDELTEAERRGIPIVAVLTPKRGGHAKSSNFPAVTRAYGAKWTSRRIVRAIRKAVQEKAREAPSASVSQQEFESVKEAISVAPDLLPVAVRGDDEIVRPAVPGTLKTLEGEFRDARPKDVLFSPKEELGLQFPKPPLLMRLFPVSKPPHLGQPLNKVAPKGQAQGPKQGSLRKRPKPIQQRRADPHK